MTLQLDFDKGKQKKILSLIAWAKEAGLINSFQIKDENTDIFFTDEEVAEILAADSDIDSGNYFTHDQAKEIMRNG